MKQKVFTYVVVLATSCAQIFAQHPDSLQLDAVTVTDYRSKLSSNNFSEVRIDSVTRGNFAASSVAQLLLQQNTAFVKAYGPANIASLTLRGSTTQQVAVIWNGLNINNPMHGQTDISLLPVGFFNSMSLQKGALSGYWGSGAMAGVLNLQSGAPVNGVLVRASSVYSSMKNFTQWAAVDLGSGRWSNSIKMLGDLALNEYAYHKDPDSLLTQKHAKARQLAVLNDASYKINYKQSLGLHLWLQDVDRQVPYTTQDVRQDASQQDRIFRSMIDWKLAQRRHSITARVAYFNEALNYLNKTYAVESNSVFNTIMADVEAQFFLPRGFTITAGNSNSFSGASTEGYVRHRQMSRSALFENIAWQKGRINITVYGRQELFNASVFVPTGGFTGGVKILKWLQAKLNAGTVYRYPTLNDLYWNPGGDPNLRPEKGYSEEGSIQVNFSAGKISFTSTGTLFNRNIHDWIMWLPGKNGTWSPQNVLEVWSRGGETNSEIGFSKKDWKTLLSVTTNYVLSTRTKTVLENDESKDRQLPYVPMYSGSGALMFEYKQAGMRAVYIYTGYRYLSSDNYNYLAPYRVVDLRFWYTLRFTNAWVNIFAEANNLLNENYFSMAQYVMPLRNFKIGVNLQLNKPNKKQT